MGLSLAVSQALATGRHRGVVSVLSGLPQPHCPQPVSPSTAPDKVDTRWQVLPSPASANMMEGQKPCPQKVNVPALHRDCLPASEGHLG